MQLEWDGPPPMCPLCGDKLSGAVCFGSNHCYYLTLMAACNTVTGTTEKNMNSQYEYLRHMEPELISRECGGWIAIAPKGAAIRIAVTAVSETEARREFALSLECWIQNLSAED